MNKALKIELARRISFAMKAYGSTPITARQVRGRLASIEGWETDAQLSTLLHLEMPQFVEVLQEAAELGKLEVRGWGEAGQTVFDDLKCTLVFV